MVGQLHERCYPTASYDAPRHWKGRDIHRPGKPVLLEAGDHWRRNVGSVKVPGLLVL